MSFFSSLPLFPSTFEWACFRRKSLVLGISRHVSPLGREHMDTKTRNQIIRQARQIWLAQDLA
ncbi:uncharacterized protein J3R85_004844 [Psidium guajava]|nr:uncharacterized protein J3R85_004844 [Psidium guajava]